jgi:hypothetical protein
MIRNVRGLLVQALGGKCDECGAKERLEIDHFIPLSKGGADTFDNVHLLCVNCHKEKHMKESTPRVESKEKAKKPKPTIDECGKVDMRRMQAYFASPVFQHDPKFTRFDREHLWGVLVHTLGHTHIEKLQARHDRNCKGSSCSLKNGGLVAFAKDRDLLIGP